MAAVSTEAAYAYRVYDEPRPLAPGDNVDAARVAVARILDARAPPQALARCGADAERLATLGYTIDDLVRRESLLFEHIVPALELTWPRLLALGFHASLLRHRNAFPVSVLVNAPIDLTAERLMDSFAFEYRDLEQWGLTQEELYVLGFDAAALIQLGMRGHHVLDALTEATTAQRGARWWVKAMRYTKALHEQCFERTEPKSSETRVAYMSLIVALR